jgi:UDP-N-acetylmuramoyl-tripeptide--D-alanyl-D-alanine ligase
MSEQIQRLYEIFREHTAVSTDSRKIVSGSIFFALKGDKYDGNRYAADALAKGAAVAVVDDLGLKDMPGVFYVKNVLNTLQSLAKFHRQQSKATFIAITGSNGKTTTKELIASVLSQKYNTNATEGNLNNHIGVPVTLLSVRSDTEFCIVEMGANHSGEISLLCEIADPDYGLITNIGKAHLEGFGSLEGVLSAKSELYDHIRKKQGRIFINEDNPMLMQEGVGIERITYGKSANCFCSGTLLSKFPMVSLQVHCRGESFRIDTNLVGDYNFENILAAVAAGSYFNVGSSSVASALCSYFPENFRSQWVETEKNILIMDAYNANPTSIQAAVQNFASGPYKNRMVILGEMLELGTSSSAEHNALVSFVRSKHDEIKDAVFIGRNFSAVDPKPDLIFESTDHFLDYLHQNPISGRTILIKGSRGNQLERIIKML